MGQQKTCTNFKNLIRLNADSNATQVNRNEIMRFKIHRRFKAQNPTILYLTHFGYKYLSFKKVFWVKASISLPILMMI